MEEAMRFILLFFLIFSFSLLQAQDTLFTETFKDGVSENTWYPEWVQNGVGNIVEPFGWANNPGGDGWVGQLTTVRPDSGNVAASFSGSPDFSDFYYEANLFLPTGGSFSGIEYNGLEFRVDSTNGTTKAYQLIAQMRGFPPASPRFRFRKRTSESPGDFVVLKNFSADEIPGGAPDDSTWHKIGINAVGNQFWFYLDGQEFPGCPYTDTTSTPLLSNGFVGTYAFILDFNPTNAVPQNSLYIDDIVVKAPLSAIEDQAVSHIPAGFRLDQNYPNPFNPTTIISFELPSSQTVQLAVYNSLGEKVRTLGSGVFSAGVHSVSWDGKNDFSGESPAGIYYYKIRAGKFVQTRKMLLIK